MSLSNRFTHPFERWMNNIVRRELGAWRGPSKSKSGSNKAMSRSNDWSQSHNTDPWGQGRWLEPWSEPWADFSEDWKSPAWGSGIMNMGSQSQINEKGQLELRATVPQGIKEEDIHLDFEEGGLRLHATKSEEHSRKLHGSKGSSSHKTHFSVSHFWPLDKSVSEKDITAHFNSDDHTLEITIDSPQFLEERSKGRPISIGSANKSHQSLDEGNKARDILEGGPAVDLSSAASRAKEYLDGAYETAKDAKDNAMGAAREAGSKAKEQAADVGSKAKEFGAEVGSKAKLFTGGVSGSPQAKDSIPDAVGDIGSKTKEYSFETAKSAKDATMDAAKTAGSKAKEYASDAAETAKTAKDATMDAAKAVGAKAKDYAADAAETAKGAKDATMEALKSAGSKTKEFFEDTSDTSKSAQGSSKTTKKDKSPFGTDPQAPSLDEM